MKKLLAMLLLIAILLPTINVEAKSTKVAQPTVSLTYNTTKGNWYVSFKHSNSKAKIYYRNSGEKKYKTLIQGKKLKVSYNSILYVRARVNSNYSSTKEYVLKNLIITKTDKDVAALAKKIVGKATTDFSKFVLISKYCSNNWTYDDAITTTTENAKYTYMHIIYDKQGVCADIAYGYQKLLNAVGVKAAYVTDDTVSKYGYSYKDDHAWTHVKIDNEWQVIDISDAVSSSFTNLQADIYGLDRDIAETNTLRLDNTRLQAKSTRYTIPIVSYLQEDDDSVMTWSDTKITNVFDNGAYIVELIYNKDLGYWEVFYTIDGITTKE